MPTEIFHAVQNLDLGFKPETLSTPEVPQSLTETVLGGGKRIRPTLCFLMGRLLKVPNDKVAPFARAAEFVHAASLAHDDVIDGALERRKKPTVNALTGNARAVLAGDFLLARVISEVADLGNMTLLKELAQAVEDLSCGEWLQESIEGNLQVTEQELLRISDLKTASLIAWCCRMPAHLGGYSPQVIQACHEFGVSVGRAFQIIDDVIDFEPTGEKPIAQDLENGYLNFVTFELLKAHPELKKQVHAIWLEDRTAQPNWPWSDAQLETAKNKTRERAEAEIQKARLALDVVVKSMTNEARGFFESVLDFNAIFLFLGGRTK